MTPEFAKAVDPIFLRVLRLLERIERGEPLSADNERRDIQGYLDQAEGHLGQRRDWELAKYALVSWIDEVLIEAPWEHRGWWKENTLEWEKFRSGECSERFFVRAKEAHSLSPPRDALEVFYLCVVLGFRGLYRDPAAAPTLAGALGLPADLETWARQISKAIPPPSRGELREESVPIQGAAPLDGPFVLIWSVFFTMILAAVTAVVAWGLYGPR